MGILPLFCPSFSSRILFLRFHPYLVCILYSCAVLHDASDFTAIKRSLGGLTDWMSLGLALGMIFHDLKSIDESHGNNVEECKTAMLQSWLETGKATKKKLVGSLRWMGEDGIADKVEWSKGKFNVKF